MKLDDHRLGIRFRLAAAIPADAAINAAAMREIDRQMIDGCLNG